MNNRKLIIVMGLALALPSSIMAVSYVVYQLVEKQIIGLYAGAALIVIYVLGLLYMMVKGANSKNTED